ncbi:AAA family ATPase [Nonomuraea sp. NPDC050556]|uniref:AAA family ATPase n=1 Tax=Nonomuraea sp. NPDC050556 TaxID=3364369 RepID=UPI0037B36343
MLVTCARCGGANPDAARFCMTCGSPLPVERARTTLRFVSVLFCDIEGSTELAGSLSPEVWGSTLSTYFAAVSRAATEQGGRVEKFIGDAAVAVFGVEATHEDDALRAVDCARAGLEEIARQAAELHRTRGVAFSVRFGIASGRVALSERDSSFAIGEVMNRAARLQTAAPSGGVAMDVRTWLLVRDTVRTQALEPVAAKGFHRPLRAWRLADGAEPEADTRLALVDRRSQLGNVLTALRAGLREPGVPVVVLAGEAGVGKSRLVAEAVRRIGAEAATVGLRCRRDGEQLGYWPLYQLAGKLGARPGQGPQSKEEIFWTLRELLRRGRPVVVVLDDCQWLPPAVREFVESLDDPALDAPAVIMLSGRLDVPLARSSVTRVPVPPLGAADTRTLAAAMGIGPELAGRSAGNPLFLEQLAHLRQDAEGGADLIAPSAEAAVGARLDRLGGDAQRLLAVVGASGGGCAVGALERVAEVLDPPVDQAFDEALDQLLDHRLLGARDGEVAVESPVVADVAYGRLPLNDRAVVHTQLADLASEQPADVDQRARNAEVELCALHAERAHAAWLELRPGGPEERQAATRAARALCDLARFAVSRGDLAMARQVAERFARLDCGLPALELEIAAVETYAGPPEETITAITRARERWDVEDNLAAAVQLALNEAVARSMLSGRWHRELIGRARELAVRAGDPAAHARVLLMEGIGHMEAGDYVAAEPVLRTALDHARRARWCFGATEIYGNLALCLAYGDTPAPAAAATCAELRTELRDAHAVRAAVGCPAALLADMTGDPVGDLLDEGQAVLTGIGHQPGLAGLDVFRATLAERHGDSDGTGEALRRAVQRYEEIGFGAAALPARLWLTTLDTDPFAPAEVGGNWDVAVLVEQAAAAGALREGRVGDAVAHLVVACARLDGVRGAGARLTPLLVSHRLAVRTGDEALVERVADLARQAAEVKHDVVMNRL